MPSVQGVDDDRPRKGYGVSGRSTTGGYGVRGESDSNEGVHGRSTTGRGVAGYCRNAEGVYGESDYKSGVHGYSDNYYGVEGYSERNYGLVAYSWAGDAALLNGNVRITGTLQISGGSSIKIDHPLDPANKYLFHSFVESPEMKRIYDGVVVLDDKGEAEVELPYWFGALNKDFRYQLTAIGAPGPNLYIAEEISPGDIWGGKTSSSNGRNNNRFKIAGGTPGMKVSWQVTGIRKDPWANAHRIPVEEDKPAKERGYYIYPELYGQPEERRISDIAFSYRRRRRKERRKR
jgi:hypothetical protein